jgi:hypothetical protein
MEHPADQHWYGNGRLPVPDDVPQAHERHDYYSQDDRRDRPDDGSTQGEWGDER